MEIVQDLEWDLVGDLVQDLKQECVEVIALVEAVQDLVGWEWEIV